MNWNAPQKSIIHVLFQFVYTLFQFIYKLFHFNSRNCQSGIIQESMNFCQRRNDSIKRHVANNSRRTPFNLLEAQQDIVSTCTANAGLSYTTTLTTINTDVGGSHKYFACVLTPGGIIYGIPRYTSYILRLDTNTDTVTKLAYGNNKRWDAAALSPDMKYLYLSPCTVNAIYKLDLETDTLSSFGTINTSSEYKYFASITSSNGNIYMASYSGLGMMEIDPADDSYTVYSNGTSTIADADYRLFLDMNGNILSPGGGRNIYKFDIETKCFSLHTSSPVGLGGGADYNIGADGNYYGLGRNSAGLPYLVKVSSTTGLFDSSVISLDSSPARSTYTLSCLAPNGRIYYQLNGSNGTPVISIGLNGTVVSETTFSVATQCMMLAPNGSIYCLPRDGTPIYKISFTYSGGEPRMFKESTLLSPLMNRG